MKFEIIPQQMNSFRAVKYKRQDGLFLTASDIRCDINMVRFCKQEV